MAITRHTPLGRRSVNHQRYHNEWFIAQRQLAVPASLSPTAVLALRVALAFALITILAACSSAPKRTLPLESTRTVPWGALTRSDLGLFESAAPGHDAVLKARIERMQQASEGRIPLRMLAISGGGIKGNYGTGVLVGWSESGKRPEFDVVTGVSVGAMMAPFVFLGSDYDEQLSASGAEAVTILSADEARPRLFKTGSTYVGEQFTALAERWYTSELIEAVAEQYRQGRRLFIGTTNLDGRNFIIWDLGMIAASERADRETVFRKALIASASFPLLFPPVMFDVDTPEGPAEQMHVDGGVTHNVFIADHDGNWARVLEDMELDYDDFCFDVYALHNGYLRIRPLKPAVENKMRPFAGAALDAMGTTNAESGIYNLWLLSMITGARFNLVSIPKEIQYAQSMRDVKPTETRKMYEMGLARGRSGTPWHSMNPPSDRGQLQHLVGGEPLGDAFERNYFQQTLSQDDEAGAARRGQAGSHCSVR